MLHPSSSPLSCCCCCLLGIHPSFTFSPQLLHVPFQPPRRHASPARRSVVNPVVLSPGDRPSRLSLVTSFTALAYARKEVEVPNDEGGQDTPQSDGSSQLRTESARASKVRSKNASAAGANIKQSGHGFAVLAALRSQLDHSSGSSFEVGSCSNEKDLYRNEGNQTIGDNPSFTNDSSVAAPENAIISDVDGLEDIEKHMSSSLSKYPDSSASEVRISEIDGLNCRNIIVGDQRRKFPRGVLKIRVSNLPAWFTNDHYQYIMKGIPGITKFNFVSDSSGKCCGYSFCEAPTERSADIAIKALNRLNIRGKSVKAVFENSQYAEHKAPLAGIDESSLKRFDKEIRAEKLIGTTIHNDTTKDQGPVRKVRKDTQRKYVGSGRGNEGRKEDAKGSIERNNLQWGRKGIPDSDEEKISKNRLSQSTVQVEKIVDGGDSGKQSLRGQEILLAMQKAAMERAKMKEKSRRAADWAGKVKEIASSQETMDIANVKPIMIRTEWAVQIENLEKRIKELKTDPIL